MYCKSNQDGSISLARTQIEPDWVEVTDHPQDRTYRDAFVLNGTVIEIDPVKQAAIDARIQRGLDGETVKADLGVKAVINASPAQIETYINTNVTDLASAKDVLIKLAKAVSAIGREAFTDE